MLLSGSITDRINGFLSLFLQSHGKIISFIFTRRNNLTFTIIITELEINPQGDLTFNLRHFGALKLISLSSKYRMISFGVGMIHLFSFDVHATFFCILTAASTQ